MMNSRKAGEIRDVILRASMAVEKIYGSQSFDIKEKDGAGPVTSADLLSNQILKDGLASIIPDAGWLSEENLDDKERLRKEYVWIVDPIDGTREFVNSVPEFSISVALVSGQIPIFGAIALPADQRIIYGGDQIPLQSVYYRFGTDPEWPSLQKEPVEYNWSRDLIGCRVLVSRTEWGQGKLSGLATDFDIHPMGSIARKLALLAAGECDLVISFKPKNEWDICGGTALIRSVPGMKIITLKDGKPGVFNQENVLSYGLAAGPEHLIDLFLKYFRDKKFPLDERY